MIMGGWRVGLSWERGAPRPLWTAYPWGYGLYMRLYRLGVWLTRPR